MSDIASTSTAAPASSTGPTPRKRRAADEPAPSTAAPATAAVVPAYAQNQGVPVGATYTAAASEPAPPPAKRSRARAKPRVSETTAIRTSSRARVQRAPRGTSGRRKGKGRARDDDDDDDDDDEDDFSAGEDGSEEGSGGTDYDETYSPAPTRTASGRRTRPTTKAVDSHRASGSVTPRKESPAVTPAPVASTSAASATAASTAAIAPAPAPAAPVAAEAIPAPVAPPPIVWNDQYARTMSPAEARELEKSSKISQQQLDQDLALPTLARLGELVWVRVPLGPPPAGALANAQLSRWPGIIRSRTVAVRNGVSESLYRVELLGMSPLDTLEAVRGENVVPWLGYIPSNTVYLDETQIQDDARGVGVVKIRWATIQSEGWLGVAVAFHRAHRIAKAYAAIQIRPIPRLVIGSHLAARPDGPSDDLASLEKRDAKSRYLTYSHVLCGPEVIHVGDFVRLHPGAQIATTAKRSASNAENVVTSLVMRIGAFYRGENRSPLMARGLMLELVLAKPEDRTYDRSLYQLPPDVRVSLPPPLPGHKWKLVRESGMPNTSGSVKEFETNVIFDAAVAGRLYPIPLDKPAHQDPKEFPKSLRDALTVKKATPGMGEEGIKALALMLAGLTTGERTACWRTPTYLPGDRTYQLFAAEEQALSFIAEKHEAERLEKSMSKAAEESKETKESEAATVNEAKEAKASKEPTPTEEPKAAEASEKPDGQVATEAPKPSEAVEEPKAPEAADKPEAQEAANGSGAPKVADGSKAPAMADTVKAPEAADAAKAPGAADAVKAPEAADTVMATEAADTVMATEATDTVMATEATEEPKKQEGTEVAA
ncbi:hypothetical protein JCM10908_000586 [Rhodotorula pacifica]|uniref:uncharacterized protein n=1 Tax=Rhodotorula pacifica TaxID=1495444 RepID=UPI003175FA72